MPPFMPDIGGPARQAAPALFDLAIIGGGINGAGIARDAAGRGLKVLLVEQGDLASGTSSASSKLIHGGLRYLEQGEFRLVREALAEREVLMAIAPHLVRPMRFVLPVRAGMRPAPLLRAGLFIYDHLAQRRLLPKTRTLRLRSDPLGAPLADAPRIGFEYSDCWVDDARLVVANAVDAAERGAMIRTRTRCIEAERGDTWRLVLMSRGRRDVAQARMLVNAAGPWVGAVADAVVKVPLSGRVRLDRGSHIVVPRLFAHDRAYILQADDRRVVFALPYEDDFTLIGTTDAAFAGDPAAVAATAEDVAYLCGVAGDYFRQPVTPADVVWSYAGVRALHDDGDARAQDVSRDYHLERDGAAGAPLLTVIGGKITTYRKLAEAVLDKLAHDPGSGIPAAPWTATAPLPGGDFPAGSLERQLPRALERWPFLTAAFARRLLQTYGRRMEFILGEATAMSHLGECFGADLTAAEVRYLMRHEWAETEDDVLWRRTKLGLRLSLAERQALGRFMAAEIGQAD